MKILLYFLTFFLGLIGILGIGRAAEVMIFGGGLAPMPTQIIISVIALLLAVVCLLKARASA
jgi:hypothetical protein